MSNKRLNVKLYGRGLKTSKKPILGKDVTAIGYEGFWDCQGQITIGDYSFLAHGVKILTGYHDYSLTNKKRQQTVRTKPVTIGKGVWIASFVIILPGVIIGDHAVVGAGSVVTKNIPARQLWAGNPAKFIKELASKP